MEKRKKVSFIKVYKIFNLLSKHFHLMCHVDSSRIKKSFRKTRYLNTLYLNLKFKNHIR